MTRQHDDLYNRALSDPDFLEAVRSHHVGTWDVLDALWWVSHPLDASPRGTSAPQAQLRALQRRVFGADADAAGDQGVHARLQELEAEIVRETAAIDAALTIALAGVGAALAGGTEPDQANVAANADAVEPADATALDHPEPAPAGAVGRCSPPVSSQR